MISFIIDTFMNFLYALMWPVFIVQFQPPLGVFALIAAFMVFNNFLRAPVERWLAADDPPVSDSSTDDSQSSG